LGQPEEAALSGKIIYQNFTGSFPDPATARIGIRAIARKAIRIAQKFTHNPVL
jgi:hypothetical protein